MSWQKKETIVALPPGVRATAQQISALASTTIQVAQLLKATVQVLSQLSAFELTQAQVVIQSAVTALESLVKGLVKDTGVYVLPVPLARRTPIPETVQHALDELGLKSLPLPDVNVAEMGLDLSRLPAAAATFAKGVGLAEGGNAGFLRLVAESLVDDGDKNRPQFGDTDYVTGLYVVAGAQNLSDLVQLMGLLRALFGSLLPVRAFDRPGLPVPVGLRARVAAGPSSQRVLLEWTPPTVVSNVPALETHVLVRQFAVLRATSPVVLGKHSVLEIFGTESLTPGLKANGVEVVAVRDIDPVHGDLYRANYLDENLSLGRDYYYAVAYNLRTGSALDLYSGAGMDIGFKTVSSWERVFYEERIETDARSAPPDWVRTPSVLALIPPLRGLVDAALLYAEQWGNVASGYAELLKAYVEWLAEEILRYERLVELTAGIVGTVGQLAATKLKAGFYVRPFETTDKDVWAQRGGAGFMVHDLAAALADPAGPPFRRGDEFVVGFVILAGAPSRAALAPVKASLDVLFGTASAQETVIRQALDELDRIVSKSESDAAVNATLASVAWVPTLSTESIWTSLPASSSAMGASGTASRDVLGGAGASRSSATPVTPVPLAIGAADYGSADLFKTVDTAPVAFRDDLQVTLHRGRPT